MGKRLPRRQIAGWRPDDDSGVILPEAACCIIRRISPFNDASRETRNVARRFASRLMTRAARWVPVAIMAAWAAALVCSTAAARVLYGDGAWFVLVHLVTPHRFDDYDIQRTFGSLISQAPVLFGQRIGLASVADHAALYAFGVYWIPAFAMGVALWIARRQALLLAAIAVAIVVYGFGVNFINTEANLLFGFAWLCVAILALRGPAPTLRGICLPILGFAMLRIYEGMLLVGPLLFLWAVLEARRTTSDTERIGLMIAGFLFLIGAVIGLGGFLSPRDPANASSFLRSTLGYLGSPQAYLFLSCALAFATVATPARAARMALAAASAVGGAAFLVASARLSGFYAYQVYYQNRAFIALSLPVLVGLLFAADRLRPHWLAAREVGAASMALLIPMGFAVAGDVLGTWRWSRYVDEFCGVLAQDRAPVERLRALKATGVVTAWPWTHPSMSVLLRDRGSLAMVSNEPGQFRWQPFEPASAPTIANPGLCQAPLVGHPHGVEGAVAISFADPGYPSSVASVRGLSGAEAWGRWSDGPEVEIRFARPLPEAFDLQLRIGSAYGDNRGAPVVVRAGSVERSFTVDREPFQATLPFRGVGKADAVVFQIPHPQSPRERGAGPDGRKLGIGFISLYVSPVARAAAKAGE
jgi:hypothetical protein